MRYRDLYEARATINGRPLLLLKNPTPDLLFFHIEGFRQGVARGSLIGEDIFMFDAYYATHAEIEEFFGVPISEKGFDIAERGHEQFAFAAPEHAMQELRANRCVQRFLSDPRVEIA